MSTVTGTSVETFLLPDVGEGLTEADIVAWHVAVGDTVSVNQPIVDIETAKSVVELPSPYAGEVTELVAAVGQTVPVGSPIIAIRTAGAPSVPSPERAPDQSEVEPKLLVGYGAKESGPHRRRRGGDPATPTGHTTAAPEPDGVAEPLKGKPRAKPPVRKLATVLGIDLSAVAATGAEGTVTRADVIAASKLHQEGRSPATTAGPETIAAGTETRIPIKGVRKHTAAAMVASAFTAPHVTEFVTVDVTRTLELRETIRGRREFRDLKLTPLAFIAHAYLRALAKVPTATARWEEDTQEIVVSAGINLGIATATPRGLMVPNIPGAHALGLRDLAIAINDLAATAREGKTPPESMVGGNATITNVGVFGVDTGTPILNPGETTILAVGAIRRQPWVVDDADGERIVPRSMLQLALSFDHRVLDGAEGSQVLADTAEILAEPGLAVL